MGHHRARDGDQPDDLAVEQVRSTLRDAADAYRPDRAAMADRVAAARAGTPPAGARRTRARGPAAAALAVAFVLIAGISVARLSSGPDRAVTADRPPASVPAVAGAGSPSAPAPAGPAPAGSVPAGPDRATPAGPASSRTPSGTPRDGPPPTATRTTRAAPDGFLTAAGAVDRNSGPTWSQDNVTITVRRPVVELTVTVTVALTPGVTEHGRYTTAPNADVTTTVTRTTTSLIYSYVLNDGRTLVPGDYLFAAQFTHEPGRDGADAYTVVARTADGGAQLSGAVTR
jgi:hypothetical protein